jgi:mannose-6-phosphate isomerase-like protein (cupin superfamily)
MSIDLATRLVRYADLRPCTNAFVDTRTPGSEKKENFTIIGPGVAENPHQYVHIAERHGFNIGGARQLPRCVNSQHSHDTAEVFVVHKGTWRFTWGENAEDGHVDLEPGDVISLPTHVFRGFENVGTDLGFLFAVLGGDDAGKVTWAPRVFEMATKFGLVLLEGGRLVDTTIGETVPPGAKRQLPPSREQITQQLRSPSAEKMLQGVLRADSIQPNPKSPLAGPGVEECALITPHATRDGFAPGPITGWWKHGFNLRCLRLETGATVAAHVRDEEEVIFVHRGTLEIATPSGSVVLGAGDTFTTPKGLARAFRAMSSDGVVAYVVRGGDEAGAVTFVDRKAA